MPSIILFMKFKPIIICVYLFFVRFFVADAFFFFASFLLGFIFNRRMMVIGYVYYDFQSLLRLKEPSVLLRCREVDRKVVESVLNEAKQEYADKAKVHAPKITVDDVYLPPPPTNNEIHGTFW